MNSHVITCCEVVGVVNIFVMFSLPYARGNYSSLDDAIAACEQAHGVCDLLISSFTLSVVCMNFKEYLIL